MSRRAWSAAIPILLAAGIIFIAPRPEAIKPEGWRLLGVFVGAVAGLVAQPLPGGAVVLVAVTLAAVFGGLTPAQALGGYGDPTAWLVLAAFFIARALIKTGLARRIALFFVRTVGGTSLGICYALTFSDVSLSTVIPSNAARSGGVTLPILRSLCEVYGSKPGKTAGLLGSFLMAAIYQNVCITSAIFLTGQASNPLAAQIAAHSLNFPITWASWFLAGSVPGLCSLLLAPLVVYRLNPPEIRRTPEAAAFAVKELEAMGPMKTPEKIVLAVFFSVCAGWATTPLHGIDITITALLGAAALLVTSVLTWEDVKNEKNAWDVFVWYGGLLMLGKALNDTGITREFAAAVAAQFGHLGWPLLLAIALLVYFYAHYGFASITAHILSMFTPFVGVLIAMGAPVGLVVFAFACFSNLAAGLTNYGTTPAPMFFAQEYVTLGRWWKVGAAVSVLNLAIWSSVGFLWWKVIGLW
ncbi:MAG: DASS family sodium-coupled anion symporter [Rhodospirillales bacterium]